jgi:DNA invertase Pin-like site-specific DNA recombinase
MEVNMASKPKRAAL